MNDGVKKYDAQLNSLAFSQIGAQGIAGGGGDTEDRRLDSSLKYLEQVGNYDFGVEYKFNGATGSANTAVQMQLGASFFDTSIDAYYSKIKDAVSASSLSAVQVAALPPLGFSADNSLAATVSDNTAYALMGSHGFGAPTVYAGYQYIRFADPSTPLAAGFRDIGGYTLAFVKNTAYERVRELQIFWAGIRYTFGPKLNLAAAYYGYKQNSYATGANAGCSSSANAGCSGSLNTASLTVDYQFSNRFDVYAGTMYSSVQNGLASGYLYTSALASTMGLRFRF